MIWAIIQAESDHFLDWTCFYESTFLNGISYELLLKGEKHFFPSFSFRVFIHCRFFVNFAAPAKHLKNSRYNSKNCFKTAKTFLEAYWGINKFHSHRDGIKIHARTFSNFCRVPPCLQIERFPFKVKPLLTSSSKNNGGSPFVSPRALNFN